MRILLLTCLVLIISACSSGMPSSNTNPAAEAISVEAIPTIDPADTRMATAQYNYNRNCAHCHGYGGEGQHPNTIDRVVNAGYHTVPAHNDSGHTWQHPDQLIFETIKYGVQAPTNFYPMGAFGVDVDSPDAAMMGLTDEEIFAVIDYIRLWWTDDQRRWQAQLTDQFAENHPDWSPDRSDEDAP